MDSADCPAMNVDDDGWFWICESEEFWEKLRFYISKPFPFILTNVNSVIRFKRTW